MKRPDYSQSVREIYTEATRAAIAKDNSLEILLGNTGLNTCYDLPSWVPDWSAEWFPYLPKTSAFFKTSVRQIVFE
jgi:hypothetical protein